MNMLYRYILYISEKLIYSTKDGANFVHFLGSPLEHLIDLFNKFYDT